MTGIILDWRALTCDHNKISSIGCDGAAINCHADGYKEGLDACLERGMDVFVVVSEGDDEIVQRLSEEKGSGVDRVVHHAEVYQLPAPLFRVNVDRTIVTIFGPKPFEDMGNQGPTGQRVPSPRWFSLR